MVTTDVPAVPATRALLSVSVRAVSSLRRSIGVRVVPVLSAPSGQVRACQPKARTSKPALCPHPATPLDPVSQWSPHRDDDLPPLHSTLNHTSLPLPHPVLHHHPPVAPYHPQLRSTASCPSIRPPKSAATLKVCATTAQTVTARCKSAASRTWPCGGRPCATLWVAASPQNPSVARPGEGGNSHTRTSST